MRLPRGESAFKAIEAPAVVGELAFFDGLPRSATLEADQRRGGPPGSDGAGPARRGGARAGPALLLDLARILALRLRMASDVIAELQG